MNLYNIIFAIGFGDYENVFYVLFREKKKELLKKMTAKNCTTCEYMQLSLSEEPCATCFETAPPYPKWKDYVKEEKKKSLLGVGGGEE